MENTEIIKHALCLAGAFSAVGFAAVGSALGCGAAGSSTIGAMKKVFAQGKNPPLSLLAYAGAALTQTIYGLVLTILIYGKVKMVGDKFPAAVDYWPLLLVLGVVAGIAMAFSAWMQGKAAAGASPAFTENDGKGFTTYLLILGLIETVALFVFAIAYIVLGQIPG